MGAGAVYNVVAYYAFIIVDMKSLRNGHPRNKYRLARFLRSTNKAGSRKQLAELRLDTVIVEAMRNPFKPKSDPIAKSGECP